MALQQAGVGYPDADAVGKRTAERLGSAQDLSLLLAHCGDDSLFSQHERRVLARYARPALRRLRRRLSAAALD